MNTERYSFERVVRGWAERTTAGWCGGRTAFFVGLREDGSPRRIVFASPEAPFDAAQKAAMSDAHPRWLLYLPHEGGVYLEWASLPQPLVERWLGRPLTASDLEEVSGHGGRDGWPESWRVVLSPSTPSERM